MYYFTYTYIRYPLWGSIIWPMAHTHTDGVRPWIFELEKSSTILQVSSVQNPCWLMIIGDYTTQYIGDYNNPIAIRKSHFKPTRIKWNGREIYFTLLTCCGSIWGSFQGKKTDPHRAEIWPNILSGKKPPPFPKKSAAFRSLQIFRWVFCWTYLYDQDLITNYFWSHGDDLSQAAFWHEIHHWKYEQAAFSQSWGFACRPSSWGKPCWVASPVLFCFVYPTWKTRTCFCVVCLRSVM